jgi:hypothetical protein
MPCSGKIHPKRWRRREPHTTSVLSLSHAQNTPRRHVNHGWSCSRTCSSAGRRLALIRSEASRPLQHVRLNRRYHLDELLHRDLLVPRACSTAAPAPAWRAQGLAGALIRFSQPLAAQRCSHRVGAATSRWASASPGKGYRECWGRDQAPCIHPCPWRCLARHRLGQFLHHAAPVLGLTVAAQWIPRNTS